MALTKRNYVSGETVITAANLNEIQDAIVALEGKGLTKEEVVDALEYTPAKASDIPTTDISANTAARHSHSNKDVLDNIAEITNISGGAVTGVANAIRSKAGITGTFPLNEFASKIESISAGASVLSGTFKPTSSAIQTITHNLGKTPIRNPNLLSD